LVPSATVTTLRTSKTVAEAITKFIANKNGEDRHAQRRARSWKWLLDLFSNWWDKTYVDEFTREDFQAFQKYLAKKGRQPRTQYNLLRSLVTFFRASGRVVLFAHDEQEATILAATVVVKNTLILMSTDMLKFTKCKVTPYTEEQLEGLLAVAMGVLKGLIGRLEEKRADLTAGVTPSPNTYFDRLNLHPRIGEVSRDLFMDGHPWEAVFAASKTLVNYVKERSGRHDLDGTSLVRNVFSKNDPVLAFNALADQTDLDEQEGMMHLFEGAVLAIRNPGGHSFPEGSEQRAIEYISFLSLLAYRVQEAKRRKP
jgi:uncharacterized protein (TIGR02391 family)